MTSTPLLKRPERLPTTERQATKAKNPKQAFLDTSNKFNTSSKEYSQDALKSNAFRLYRQIFFPAAVQTDIALAFSMFTTCVSKNFLPKSVYNKSGLVLIDVTEIVIKYIKLI
jgi:hypothetical protein